MLKRFESVTRYYVLMYYRDLFNDHIVAQHWGGKGNRLGSKKFTKVKSKKEALTQIQEISKIREKRKYREVPVFTH